MVFIIGIKSSETIWFIFDFLTNIFSTGFPNVPLVLFSSEHCVFEVISASITIDVDSSEPDSIEPDSSEPTR